MMASYNAVPPPPNVSVRNEDLARAQRYAQAASGPIDSSDPVAVARALAAKISAQALMGTAAGGHAGTGASIGASIGAGIGTGAGTGGGTGAAGFGMATQPSRHATKISVAQAAAAKINAKLAGGTKTGAGAGPSGSSFSYSSSNTAALGGVHPDRLRMMGLSGAEAAVPGGGRTAAGVGGSGGCWGGQHWGGGGGSGSSGGQAAGREPAKEGLRGFSRGPDLQPPAPSAQPALRAAAIGSSPLTPAERARQIAERINKKQRLQ